MREHLFHRQLVAVSIFTDFLETSHVFLHGSLGDATDYSSLTFPLTAIGAHTGHQAFTLVVEARANDTFSKWVMNGKDNLGSLARAVGSET